MEEMTITEPDNVKINNTEEISMNEHSDAMDTDQNEVRVAENVRGPAVDVKDNLTIMDVVEYETGKSVDKKNELNEADDQMEICGI